MMTASQVSVNVKTNVKMSLKHFRYEEFDSPDLPNSGAANMDSNFLSMLDSARGLLVYPSKFLLDSEQMNTINRLVQEDIQRVQTQAILKERQQILSAKAQQIDGLSLQPYKKQVSVGLGLAPHSFMWTQATYGNLPLLYGLTKTDTVGSTLND